MAAVHIPAHADQDGNNKLERLRLRALEARACTADAAENVATIPKTIEETKHASD